jgi:hypothetical protein
MANKANDRDQASIYETRDSAKPWRRFATRNPSSQQNRKPHSLAIGSARNFRFLLLTTHGDPELVWQVLAIIETPETTPSRIALKGERTIVRNPGICREPDAARLDILGRSA